MGIFRTSRLGDGISSDPERIALRRGVDESGCIGLQQRAGISEYQNYFLRSQEIRYLKIFGAFLCMGRCKSLDSLKSFLSYASQLSGARILSFSHRVPQGSL